MYIMKKFLLLLGTLLCAFNLSAQNYDSDYYLRQAYSALEEGKIEVAQSSYNVYKKATGKTDSEFEILLKDKIDNDWQKSCHILDLGNGYYLAVQKVDESNPIYLNPIEAENRCKSSRLGGFSDWRLPGKDELSVILANHLYPVGYYWSTDFTGLPPRRVKKVSFIAAFVTDKYGNPIPGNRSPSNNMDYYNYYMQHTQGNIKHIRLGINRNSNKIEIIILDGSHWTDESILRQRYLTVRVFEK